MNKKVLVLSLLLVLVAVYMTSMSTVKAVGNGEWITKYIVTDENTGKVILDRDFVANTTSGNGELLEGEELKITATISISINNPSAILTLGTSMQHSDLQPNMYWQVESTNYSIGAFNPNSRSITFGEYAGNLVVDCYGKCPSGEVQEVAPNGVTLDIPRPLMLVTLQDPTGAVLDQIQLNVTDATIDQYLSLLSQKEASLSSLQSSGVDPGFIAIYSNVISVSQALESEGFSSTAITLLNGLNVSAPPSATMQGLFLPIAGVLAAVAVVFAFMFLRIRGRISYFQLVVEEQIKDLEGLTLRASKIDRTMGSSLDSVKERLMRLVGA
jgi:hypothetical protein